jgi:hypothetical protein
MPNGAVRDPRSVCRSQALRGQAVEFVNGLGERYPSGLGRLDAPRSAS